MLTHRNLLMACFAALLALGLAACGTGGSNGPAAMGDPDPDPAPTPVAVALPTDRPSTYTPPAAGTVTIAAGQSQASGDVQFTCAAGGEACAVMVAADGTVTSLGGTVTAALTPSSRAALDAEKQRQLEMRRAAQQLTITNSVETAKAAIEAVTGDATSEQVQAAEDAVEAVRAAIDAGEDLTEEQRKARETELSELNTSLTTAKEDREEEILQRRIDERDTEQRQNAQRTNIENAIGVAQKAVDLVNDDATDEAVTAADTAIAAARGAILAGVDLPEEDRNTATTTVDGLQTTLTSAKKSRLDAIEAGQLADRIAMQRQAITDTIAEATRTVGAVGDESTDEDVAAADAAIKAARDAVAAADDLTDGEKLAATQTIAGLSDTLSSAKQSRIVAMNEQQRQDEIDRIAGLAADAETAADTAATEAEDAATMAETYAGGRALIQTALNSATSATDARTHAGYARAAADDAQTAADEAAAATTVADAVAAQGRAETAQKSAEDHRGHVTSFRDTAVDAAANEVKVVDGGHQVGDTAIMTAAKASSVTDDDQTTITGLMKDDNPDHMAAMVDGVAGAEPNPDATPTPLAYVAPTAAVAVRTFDIGKVIDSADDIARLMLVTSYAGSRTVNVYASLGIESDEVSGVLLSDGRIQTDGEDTVDDATDDRFVTLKPAGMYYLGLTAAELRGDGTEVVSATAKPVQVYSYSGAGPDGETDTADDVSGYAVYREETTTAAGVTTISYAAADITFAIDRDGDAETPDVEVPVTAKIPDATAYKHINFGVWAALGEAAMNGDQDITALGTGFVQSIGDGLTPMGGSRTDMPNSGKADYNGNWAATVQAANEDGEGAITLQHGVTSIKADFGEGDITVNLMMLAKLTGDIDGNTFEGDTAETMAATVGGVKAGSKDFTGTFTGGFFGDAAAEAGGAFSFTSEDDEDGGFAGAFGGNKE